MLIFLNLQKNFRESSPTSESCKMKAENHTRKLENKETLNPFWNGCKTELPRLGLWTQSSPIALLAPSPSVPASHTLAAGAALLPAGGAYAKATVRRSTVPTARKCSRCRAALRSHKPPEILPWTGRSIFQVWSCLQTWHPSLPKPNPVYTLVSRISRIRSRVSHEDDTAVP